MFARAEKTFAPAAGGERDRPAPVSAHAFAEIQPGLSLQLVDLRTGDAQSHRAVLPPSLGLSLLLKGGSDIHFARQRYRLGAPARGGRRPAPEAALFRAAQALEFTRHLDAGMHLRHLSIQATPDWLERSGLADYGAAAPVLGGSARFDLSSWTPSAHTVALCEHLLQDAAPASSLARLQRESRILEIVVHTLGALGSTPAQADAPSARVLRRMQGVRERLESDAGGAVTLDALAREFGMGVDTLQRQFRAAFGTTVFGHLHEHRMQRARRAIAAGSPVSSAAYAAGYGSPANFSTAFRRRFGITPKQARGG